MTLEQNIQVVAPGAIIDLYELDFNAIGVSSIEYFYPGKDANGADIVFNSITYQARPIVIAGMNTATSGPATRPTMSIANINGYITALLKAYQDAVGVKVTRRRTFEKYLDGKPDANPTAVVAEVFYINRKMSENATMVTFELASAIDMQNKMLPSRLFTDNFCPWIYKGTTCGYAGSSYFDKSGNPVGSSSLDVCGKRLVDCRLRFTGLNRMPFGGFPGTGKL